MPGLHIGPLSVLENALDEPSKASEITGLSFRDRMRQRGEDSSSVFFATYSFTETDALTRERFRVLIQNFEIIFLVFWSTWEGSDNDAYLKNWLEVEKLEETHYILIWKCGYGMSGFNFVARRKDSGGILCNPDWNCHWWTKHHSLPRGGLRKTLFVAIGMPLVMVFVGLLFWACVCRPKKSRTINSQGTTKKVFACKCT